ncbi:hypothetical protein [Marinicella meishanensis]|uniref:hypothetical protein n=1 Tax=Marinicella meishanensis TaxID=2873263 RepID=UPI001CBB872C|nr:hypothetical protein [Marinicella sp. NBU2979]
MSRPGYCQVAELPPPYLDQFTAGGNSQFSGQFLPAQAPNNARLLAVLFGLMYFLPVVYLLWSGLLAWYSRAPWLSRVVDDLSGSWGKQLVALLLGAVMVAGLAWMLRMAWLAWCRFHTWQAIQHSTAGQQGAHGLLLNADHLVFRHGDYFDDHTVGWLPKVAIHKVEITTVRQWFPKRSFHIPVVRILYHDGEQIKAMILKERFGLSAQAMGAMIERWLATDQNQQPNVD